MRALSRFGAKRNAVNVDDLKVAVISISGLIANKRASDRTQGLVDVEKLEALEASIRTS